ncbi:hypothetical protein J4414_00975 [Candidatus Woesearchaeota archaeon]|nr:hypothetical protein [Candidatus Woesearchaeota archaeon]
MKISTIQVYDNTKKKLENKKVHPRESYDSVIKRILEDEKMPSIEQMFKHGDALKQKKKYSTKEVIKLTHELRGE